MIHFPIHIKPGLPIYEQIVFAVKKALVRGSLQPGDRFPSVRVLARYLTVNPPPVQKAVAELTRQGFLEVRPGRGCFIAARKAAVLDPASLKPLAEKLLIEAIELSIDEECLFRFLSQLRRELEDKNE